MNYRFYERGCLKKIRWNITEEDLTSTSGLYMCTNTHRCTCLHRQLLTHTYICINITELYPHTHIHKRKQNDLGIGYFPQEQLTSWRIWICSLVMYALRFTFLTCWWSSKIYWDLWSPYYSVLLCHQTLPVLAFWMFTCWLFLPQCRHSSVCLFVCYYNDCAFCSCRSQIFRPML